MLGVDVGSTTVKVVIVDPLSRRIVWRSYERHETRQPEKTRDMIRAALRDTEDEVSPSDLRVFLTGSGARPIAPLVGGGFVQEVNAVTIAVETLYPDAGSVIELGGQDAKIIIFKEAGADGEKRALTSMNDKCASGTGATIDKCLLKVGLSGEQVGSLRFDPSRLHKIAAKCGVFAETDVVNLVKSGIPPVEIIASLGNAIVAQNLAVLTRGNTLRPRVLLLGGPNTYLRFLQDCWRLRIPETWKQRGFDPPDGTTVEDLIVVPEDAQYYAAYGAAIHGLEEPEHAGRFRGLGDLERSLREGERRQRAGAGPPLVANAEEAAAFAQDHRVPPFEPPPLQPGDVLRAAIGLDGGSTSSKAVLVREDGVVAAKAYRLSEGNPIADMKALLADLRRSVEERGGRLDVVAFGATGYAADVIEECVRADVNIVETVAHGISASFLFDDIDVICDVGGQDIKVLFVRNKEIRDFRLSNQCSAGNGMLLQAMADQFGVPVTKYAETAFKATQSPVFGYGCAVFLDSDRVDFQKEGWSREELLAGLALVLPKNIWQYVVQIPRMSELGTRFVLQGGTQYNLAAVKAQVDYIRKRVPGARVYVHPHCGEAGAIGAALEALRVVSRRGKSTFIGIDRAIELEHTTRTDETTRCRFCPNLCSRTFVDAHTPDGGRSRYISGFSCELGTVESKEAMLELVQERKALKARHVNLVEYEARLAFRRFYTPAPLPEEGTEIDDVRVSRGLFGRQRRRAVRRGFERSSAEAQARRERLRIGIPRVLNLYSTAPFFRAYFETLGIPSSHIRFSPATSEELVSEGMRYGSVDPCFPAKAAQAHVHHLLFREHHPPERALDLIFFPTITHVPTFVEHTVDSTCCPVVAGTPNVLRAAFTAEHDFLAARGIEWVDGAVTLTEPAYVARQMFEMWGERLGVTEDESDAAIAQAFEALSWFDREMERRGLELLDTLERENQVGLLVLSRPYHADPGLHHDVLEQFQALGYPILSIRSIPKDPEWLRRWFRDDIERGRIESPLDLRDVWPENYSTNSVQKVWAAKFAARHPNLAVLDLSSFKCGHDAPTYGLIDEIIKASATPYLALHDLDANKPAGSQKIRVKTYAHTLARLREELSDRALRESELERRVKAKRQELIAERQAALAALEARDALLRHELRSMDDAFETYLEEEESVFGMREGDLAPSVSFPASAPRFHAIADIAPLSPSFDGGETWTRPIARRKTDGDKTWLELPVLPIAKAAHGCGGSASMRLEKER